MIYLIAIDVSEWDQRHEILFLWVLHETRIGFTSLGTVYASPMDEVLLGRPERQSN